MTVGVLTCDAISTSLAATSRAIAGASICRMTAGSDPERIVRLTAALDAAFGETSADAAEETEIPSQGSAIAGRTIAGVTVTGAAVTGPLTVDVVRAPSSVNLIGDHTDYNEGLVLAAAIDLETWIAYRRRRDGLVRVAQLGSAERGSFWIGGVEPGLAGSGSANGAATGSDAESGDASSARSGAGSGSGIGAATGSGADPTLAAETVSVAPADAGRWADCVAATAWSLREAALPIRGFDGIVDSALSTGTGSSPSAALELASALALLGDSAVLAPPALAALTQRAERDYLGLDSGIVDQFTGAAGRAGRAMLLDCRSLESRHVLLPWGLRVVVCDSGSPADRSRREVERDRRAECGRAVALIAERIPWVCSLRDLDVALLRRHRSLLTETVARRAEHVVGENARVVGAAAALQWNDLDELGRLFAESHASLRNLYEVGSPAVDAMVDVALAVPGVVAARMIGAVAGGSTVNLVLEDAVPALVSAVESEYRRRTGLAGKAYPVGVVDGAGPATVRKT
jgi:galactokinase